MGTYDFTPGSKAENAAMMAYGAAHEMFVLKRNFLASVAVASDTTLTSNGKITAADVLKIIAVPDDTLILFGGVKILGTWTCTDLDFGRAGGDEIFDGYDIATASATLGTQKMTAVSDDWGADNVMGYAFTAADTLDLTFQADETNDTAGSTSTDAQGLFWVLAADISEISVDTWLA